MEQAQHSPLIYVPPATIEFLIDKLMHHLKKKQKLMDCDKGTEHKILISLKSIIHGLQMHCHQEMHQWPSLLKLYNGHDLL